MSHGLLQGRRAIVTGGANGIGRAIAQAFAREGADVAIWDRDAQAADNLGMTAMCVDVRDPDQTQGALDRVVERFGGVDVLVNNAGSGSIVPFLDVSVELWHQELADNLTPHFLCSKLVLPFMLEQRWGRIINISSQLAFKGEAEMVPYTAAKAAVLGLTRALAREVAPFGVTVNAIAPGPTRTATLARASDEWRERKLAELPLGRFAEPEEIAPTAVLLASDGGAFYTGATLNVSGGDVIL